MWTSKLSSLKPLSWSGWRSSICPIRVRRRSTSSSSSQRVVLQTYMPGSSHSPLITGSMAVVQAAADAVDHRPGQDVGLDPQGVVAAADNPVHGREAGPLVGPLGRREQLHARAAGGVAAGVGPEALVQRVHAGGHVAGRLQLLVA